MDDNKPRGAAGVPENRVAIQGDKDSPGKQANMNLMKSNRDKSKAPALRNTGWALLDQEKLCPKGLGAQQAGHGPAGLQRWATASWAVWRTSQMVDGRSLLQRCVVGEQQPWA